MAELSKSQVIAYLVVSVFFQWEESKSFLRSRTASASQALGSAMFLFILHQRVAGHRSYQANTATTGHAPTSLYDSWHRSSGRASHRFALELLPDLFTPGPVCSVEP